MSKVALIGDSLLITALRTSFQFFPQLEVIPVEGMNWVGSASVIIIDMNSMSLESILTLARKGSGAALIGLDAAGEAFLFFSGYTAQSMNTTRLVNLIESLPGLIPA